MLLRHAHFRQAKHGYIKIGTGIVQKDVNVNVNVNVLVKDE
jgi:hypothetical protein